MVQAFHLLITRPREDAQALAAILSAQNISSTIEPLIEIEPIFPPPVIDLTKIHALLFTSRNGVRIFAHLSTRRDILCYAVGLATATTLRELGFTQVIDAGGDSETLLSRMTAELLSDAGKLLHIGGENQAGDLAGKLVGQGYDCRHIALYHARAISHFSLETRTALAERRFSGVLFFSPRTANTFVRLVKMADLMDTISGLTAYCLSPAVAAAVADLPWAKVAVAVTPDQPTLLRHVMKDQSGMSMNNGQNLPAPRRTNRILLWLLVLLLVITGVLAISRIDRSTLLALINPPAVAVSTPPLPNDPAPVVSSADVEILTAQIKTLSAEVTKLQSDLTRLQEKVTDSSDLSQHLDDMQQQIKTLKEQFRQENDSPRKFGLVLAAGQLRQSALRGQSYVAELEAAKKLGAATLAPAAFEILATQANTGLVAERDLARSFADLVPKLLRDEDARIDVSWWDHILGGLQNLVRIRRTGDVVGVDNSAVVARMEAHLGRDDVAAAVKEAKGLSGVAANTVKPWLAMADRRLIAEQALIEIEAAALSALDPARTAP